jgi:isochorismate synthase
MEVEKKIAASLRDKIPFVMYRKPNSTKIVSVFQKDTSINFTHDFVEKGFVFAPFDGIDKTLLIPDSISERKIFDANSISFEEKEKTNSELGKKEHIALVEKGINFINTSEIDKVVLSRKEKIEVEGFDCWETFKKLTTTYPNAFVYLWFHPVSGMWLGATPEVLLSIKNERFKIMSLASTQEYKVDLDVVWNAKEIEEHQIVTDYIVSKLEKKNLKISETYTVKAGSLVHLRADISGRISSSDFDLKKMIQVLHPTPAICGMPKELAKEFILKNENYHREYYTGFLGEINDKTIDLFVNLRCMKLDANQKQVSLYIGGGITKDSNATLEWEETVAKSKVMKKVLF